MQRCGKIGWRTGWALGLALAASGARGQELLVSSGVSATAGEGGSVAGEIVRSVADPHSGRRWLLLRDADHPGGPGRFVLAEDRPAGSEGRPLSSVEKAERLEMLPVIRAGDRLVVEEHTAVADARLEAVAMGPAAMGATLSVRLAIGGRMVRAVALGPGRAVFAQQVGPEARP